MCVYSATEQVAELEEERKHLSRQLKDKDAKLQGLFTDIIEKTDHLQLYTASERCGKNS